MLLLRSGDIETNPGPFPSLPSLPSFDKKEDPLLTLQDLVDERLSELKDLVEKQSDMILDLNTKIEECNQDLTDTKQDLEDCKTENAKLRGELGQQNTKFVKMFESLEQEGITIKNTASKQKVNIHFDGSIGISIKYEIQEVDLKLY